MMYNMSLPFQFQFFVYFIIQGAWLGGQPFIISKNIANKSYQVCFSDKKTLQFDGLHEHSPACTQAVECVSTQMKYSRVPNKHRPTFINFGSFFQGLRSYLRQLHYYLGVYVYCFSQFFPGSTLIWGPTLIRNSRVSTLTPSSDKGLLTNYVCKFCKF